MARRRALLRPQERTAIHDRTPESAGKALSALTEREREVPGLVAGGLSNEEIARRLCLSPLTAKTHRRGGVRR